MKFGRIDAAGHKLDLIEADSFDAATRACRLEPLQTDHDTVWRLPGVGGIGIVVAQYSMFVPPINQNYFAIMGNLYAGNALLYCFDGNGVTTEFDDVDLVEVRWFQSGQEVASAITRGELPRPEIRVNGVLEWEWPQPKPDLDKIAAKVAQGLARWL